MKIKYLNNDICPNKLKSQWMLTSPKPTATNERLGSPT